VNLSDSKAHVAMSYLKKYARKLAIEWPLKGLRYGLVAALVLGGAGYAVASAAAQRARSLFFRGRGVGHHDPAAKEKPGFLARMFMAPLQETLAQEVSRLMGIIAAIGQCPQVHSEMGGEILLDTEKPVQKNEFLNPEVAARHPRFEVSALRVWEYDEIWLRSDNGKRARVCSQSFLTKKEEEEIQEDLKKKEKSEQDKEKNISWTYTHLSVFFDDDTSQLVLVHNADEAANDLLILPNAEWLGDKPTAKASSTRRDPPRIIDAEVVETSSKR